MYSPCIFKHPPDSGVAAPASGVAAPPVTLQSKAFAAAAVHDTLAYDMAEIKTMLYGIIKEQAELKTTISVQQAINNEQQALITGQKAFITHMLAEDLPDD